MSRVTVIVGGHGSGKTTLLKNVENIQLVNSVIGCPDSFKKYFDSRYDTVSLEEFDEKKGEDWILYKVDEQGGEGVIYGGIDVAKVKTLLDDGDVVVNICGDNFDAIQQVQKEFENVRVVLIAVEPHTQMNRLLSTGVFSGEEAEKISQKSKLYFQEYNEDYVIKIMNNSSIDEGVRRLRDALNLTRTHSENVDLFYPEKKNSKTYLADHKINELCEHLLSKLVYEQPDDPRLFLIEEITKIQANKPFHLLTNEELDVMFQMIDVNRSGSVTLDQVVNSLQNLGISKADYQDTLETLGSDITKPKFIEFLSGVLLKTYT